MRILFYVIASCFLLVSASAYAQPNIAVVDIERMLTESKAAHSIQKQVKTEREKFLNKLSKQEQSLRALEKKLIESSKGLTPEDIAKKRKTFETEYLETRQLVQKQRADLDKAVSDAMNRLSNKIFEVVQKIATDKGYDLVITKQSVVVGAKNLDISDACMSALNNSVSNIQLKI